MSLVDAERAVLLLEQERAIQLVELAGERGILSVPRDPTSRALGCLSRSSPGIVRYDDARIVVTDHEGTWSAPAVENASRVVDVALSRHGVLAALVVRDDDTSLLQLSGRNGESSCIEIARDHLFGGLTWARGGESKSHGDVATEPVAKAKRRSAGDPRGEEGSDEDARQRFWNRREIRNHHDDGAQSESGPDEQPRSRRVVGWALSASPTTELPLKDP